MKRGFETWRLGSARVFRGFSCAKVKQTKTHMHIMINLKQPTTYLYIYTCDLL
jgi:hypothetical protein